MRFTKLPTVEKAIQTGASNDFKLEAFSIPIKGESIRLDGYTIRPQNGYQGYFFDEAITKEKIVLHFTAGHLRGDLFSLTDKVRGHVSVPFVIARDGTIYQLFSSKSWSYHLGKKALGGNGSQSKKSIGIELSNYGPLTFKEGNLETIYSRMKNPNTGKIGPQDIYCSKEDTDLYMKLKTPFRTETYFATFTEAQYESLIILLRYLTNQYDIPRAFLPIDTRYEATEDVVDFKGIVSHVNYRISGKWDLGPAFEWDKVIRGVQSKSFAPKARLLLSIKKAKSELKKAKKELLIAQQKVNAIESKIETLESTPLETRSISLGNKLKSETAIEKKFPRKKQSSNPAKLNYDKGEGPDDNEIDFRKYYL